MNDVRLCRAVASRWRIGAAAAACTGALGLLAGCGGLSVVQRNTVGGVVATAVLGHAPTSNIQQVYYLGVFDPRDQLSPTFYRVRVQGQASAISQVGFASGWVRAELIDSLAGRVATPLERKEASAAGGAGGSGAGSAGTDRARDPDRERKAGELTGRRLVMFGPEGFREAPADHRLVIVMGSDPSAFFSGVDQALGIVAQATQSANAGPDIERLLWRDLGSARLLRERVELVIESAK